jgi:hypothetical protein
MMKKELIAENARVAQNQDDYNRGYDKVVSHFEATKAERDTFAVEIRQRGIRRREFE